MKHKSRLLAAGGSGLLVIILIVLIRFVDVAEIGAGNTSIGLSHLNGFVYDLFGVNMLWYSIPDWLGIVPVLTAFVFAVTGLSQLIKRKSLFKVDRQILALGGLYLLTIGLYILFETVIINYRPIILPGSFCPEASFPSSHTMMVCVIMGSTAILMNKYSINKLMSKVIRLICFFIIGITVFGRLVSGVHWFTDIIGGILISITLLLVFKEVISNE